MKKLSAFVSAILLLLVLVPNVFAVSEAAVLFLLITPNSRAGGMGEAFVALADDASAVFWNPAGLAFQEGKQFTSMYAKWLPQFNLDDLYYVFAAYRHSVEGLGTIGANLTFINLGQQQVTLADSPEPVDSFNSNEFALTLSYATLLSESFGIGLNVRYIRSNLSSVGIGSDPNTGQANAFSIDFGVLKRNIFMDRLNFGLNISNIGPKITFVDAAQADPLPTNLRVGFAYNAVDQEFNKLTFVADVNKLLVHKNEDGTSDSVLKSMLTSWENNDIIYNVGGEYWYANLIALRAGYNYDRAGKVKYLTLGAGLRYAIYQFDFGYISAGENHPLSDTMRFSLTIGR
ncbi:PorV/PorQ family protein [bacterium]|nr:PorV/PorQ family protein [bacterium]